MFASKVAKPKTKAAVSSTGNKALQREADTGRWPTSGASWDFNRNPLCPPNRGSKPSLLGVPRLLAIQAKLVVGQANDPLEHEADRLADQVMRRHHSCGRGTSGQVYQPPDLTVTRMDFIKMRK